ncbi:MAG: hypothetical protein K6G81_06510, partial [Lachnospiraceae bacterium]|nr:hypothetical protein [Lachnospiraceae bacterium]
TQSVMYMGVSDMFNVFARIDGKNVICGKIPKDSVGGGTAALSMGMDLFLGHKGEGTSKADHAVDELADVLKKLEAGESVSTSERAATVASNSTGSEIKFFMKQKAISLKPKFDIFDEKETPVYHIEGDLPRLNFGIQKNGTEVVKLKKKLVAVMPEYTIVIGGSEIGQIKKKLKLTAPELVGTINGKELKIDGDLFGFNFDIRVGGTLIGHIDTAQTIWQDCYRIVVYDESYQDIMVTLTIICDNVVDSNKN